MRTTCHVDRGKKIRKANILTFLHLLFSSQLPDRWTLPRKKRWISKPWDYWPGHLVTVPRGNTGLLLYCYQDKGQRPGKSYEDPWLVERWSLKSKSACVWLSEWLMNDCPVWTGYLWTNKRSVLTCPLCDCTVTTHARTIEISTGNKGHQPFVPIHKLGNLHCFLWDNA